VAVGLVLNIPEPEIAFHWPGFMLADPAKESQASTIRLAGNMTTLAAVCARDGHDWEEVLQQRAIEQARMKELGLLPAAPITEPEVTDGGDTDTDATEETDAEDDE